MKAVVYEKFLEPPTVQNVRNPEPPANGIVLRVGACGICRSDWHGWMGNDPDIKLPHVPGHELAGTIEMVGRDVKNWQKGDRVTPPCQDRTPKAIRSAAGSRRKNFRSPKRFGVILMNRPLPNLPKRKKARSRPECLPIWSSIPKIC